MKTRKTIGLAIAITLAIGAVALYSAENRDFSRGYQDSGWLCPWAGQGYDGMGPGMMWDRGDWDDDT